MGFINLAEKTVSAKLVYYGCGMGGKTTSLQVVHEFMCPRNEVQLVSIKTEEDATLLFDFLPIDLGQVEGFKVRIQGFTVPGQPKYRRMRKYVLSGADAVVFVVDSETSRLEENIQSLENLRENLQLNGLDESSIPIVVQYNKRDLEDILSEAELDEHFRFRDDILSFPSVATEGRGVFEAFVEAAGQLVEAKVRLYGLGRGRVEPEQVAEGARQRLWEIFDRSEHARAQREQKGNDETKPKRDAARPHLELTFDEDGHATGVEEPTELEELEPLDLDEPVEEAEILTDEDLEFDLAPEGAIAEPEQPSAGTTVDDEEPLPALLDATVATNIELVERYGDLERYCAQLERKNRELVKVTQNVVHDLNRPLSAIRLMLSSMQKGYAGELGDTAKMAVDNGLAASHQMERLIRDLLDSSRLDFDGVRLEFSEVDLAVLVARILDGMRYELEEHGVGVRVEPMPVVMCDEWAMTRVIGNLLGNAVQYHHPDRAPRIWVSAEEDGDRHVVTVRDNGIGIPKKDLPKLFQRFVRGSNTGGISGTGLGLHITREIMLGHGGDAFVESVEGEGTTFRLALPFEPVQPPHSALSDMDGVEAHDPELAHASSHGGDD